MAGLVEEMEDLKVRRTDPEPVVRLPLAELGMLSEKHAKRVASQAVYNLQHSRTRAPTLPERVQRVQMCKLICGGTIWRLIYCTLGRITRPSLPRSARCFLFPRLQYISFVVHATPRPPLQVQTPPTPAAGEGEEEGEEEVAGAAGGASSSSKKKKKKKKKKAAAAAAAGVADSTAGGERGRGFCTAGVHCLQYNKST